MMKFVIAAFLAVPAKAQLTGCQYTSGPLQLQKVRSTASGTQIFGCINDTFDRLSSTGAANSTSSVHLADWGMFHRISGLSTGTVGVQISSYTWFTSSVTISGGSLAETYGISAATLTTTGNVNVGTTTSAGNGKLQVYTGASGATAHVNADEVVLESNGNAGLSILTPNNATGAIFFGDPQDATVGQVSYNHNTNDMAFQTAAGNRMNVLGDGNIHVVNRLGVGTASPGYPLQVQSAAITWSQANGAQFGGTTTASSTTFMTGGMGTVQMAMPANAQIQSGSALCINTSRMLSHCSNAVDASGNCTCP